MWGCAKALAITLTVSFWTACSFLTSPACLPWNHSWHPYVSTSRQIALYARHQLAWSRPQTELPRSCREKDYTTSCKVLLLSCCQLGSVVLSQWWPVLLEHVFPPKGPLASAHHAQGMWLDST